MAAGAVIALTALGALLSSIDARLAGTTRPHATLTGSLGDALSILQNNARVLAAPFLLYLLGFPASRTGRLAGDMLVALLTAASALPVGLELGRWHAQLLPFLPQLPLEWTALAVAISAWLAARHNHGQPSQLAVLATLTLALLVAAAALETWATPNGHTRPAANDQESDRPVDPLGLCVPGACLRAGFCAAGGPLASRSHAPFPSLRSVPLARLAGAIRATSTTRPPQGGIT
jgi:hypothetical protein